MPEYVLSSATRFDETIDIAFFSPFHPEIVIVIVLKGKIKPSDEVRVCFFHDVFLKINVLA